MTNFERVSVWRYLKNYFKKNTEKNISAENEKSEEKIRKRIFKL